MYFGAIAGNMCIAAGGAMLGWTSPVFPILEKDGGPLAGPISKNQTSWIGSLVSVGAFIGCFIAGYLSERYVFAQL